MTSGSPRPQLLFIAPVMPDVTGSGTPMRAGIFLEALSRQFDVHLLVVTLAGAASTETVPAFVKAHTIRVLIHQGLLQGVGAAVARLRGGTSHKNVLAQEFLDFTKVARASAQLLDRPGLARYATDEVVEAALAPLADQIFDVVHVMRLYMAPFAERFLAASGPTRPACVLDLDDHESEKSMRLSALYALTGDRASAEREAADAKRYAAMESQFLPRFDRSLVCSERDRRAVAERYRLDSITVVPNAIRSVLPQVTPSAEDRWSFVFVGALSYFPNIDAVRFFCREILPRIRARGYENATIAVVGALAPGQLVKELAATPGVTLVGRVPDPAPYYDGSTVSIVPLRAAGGTRIKLLEAFAHGTPAVSTTLGAEGLEVVHDQHLLLADNADDFADACVRLLGNEEIRARLAREASRLVRAVYDVEVVAEIVRGVFHDVGSSVHVVNPVADKTVLG